MAHLPPSSPAPAHRRELVRRYKDEGTPMGVYVVRNLANGRVLVGTSMNLEAIFNRHRFQLRMGGHRCTGLQRDWHAQGGENFAFEVAHRLQKKDDPAFDPEAELAVLLELWRAELDPEGRGYAQHRE